jgi:hypothetical protein
MKSVALAIFVSGGQPAGKAFVGKHADFGLKRIQAF